LILPGERVGRASEHVHVLGDLRLVFRRVQWSFLCRQSIEILTQCPTPPAALQLSPEIAIHDARFRRLGLPAGTPNGSRSRPASPARKYHEFAHQLSGVTVRKILEDLVTSDLLLSSPIAIENYTKGQAEGEAKGEADAVLLVLKTRGLTLTDAQRTRIAGCTDLSLLRTWVTRAVTTTSVDDLFD
jgi:hypothetical protein